MAGFLDRFGPFSNNRFNLSGQLKKLSSFGMKYDDMVIRQSQAIGVMEDKFGYGQINPLGLDTDDMWYPFASLSMSDVGMRKQIGFFDIGYPQRREELREFSLHDEVEEILDTLCDEAVVYDDQNFFARPSILNAPVSEEVEKYLHKAYQDLYSYFGFNQDQSAWYFFRKWLVDGYLAFEIIYNDKQDEIIGFKELDPISLVPAVDKDSNKKMWIQYKDDAVRQRELYDSQIIYLSYASISTASRTSYAERLVRAFNIMRIMEHTRVIWAVTNASFKMKFIIPVGGKSKTRAKQSLSQLMHNYKEVIDFDYTSGKLDVNGSPLMQFNKEYWLPSKDGEQPEIETLGNEGPDLADTEALKYFADKLKLASKIPFSRFDTDSPATYEMSAEGLIREEIKFAKFIKRLRSSFQEILVKPLFLQLALKFPEIANDPMIKAQVSLAYNEENMFAELKEMEIMEKRVDFISNMKDTLVEQDEEMNDVPYFNLDFLVKRYLKMKPEDLEKNSSIMKKKEEDKKEEEEEGIGGGGLDF